MLHCWYSYAAPLVQGCCTIGARLLHFSGTVFSNCLKTDFPLTIIALFMIYRVNHYYLSTHLKEKSLIKVWRFSKKSLIKVWDSSKKSLIKV